VLHQLTCRFAFLAVAENQPKLHPNKTAMSSLSSFAEFVERLLCFMDAQGEASGESCESEFNSLALELFALQWEHVPVYRRLCAARGILPTRISHWTQIPALPTSAFKEFEVTCLLPVERARIFHSSGTTQHRPSRHFHDEASLRIYESSLTRWFGLHLLPERHRRVRLISLLPRPESAPHSSLMHMVDTVTRAFSFTKAEFVGQVSQSGGWSIDLPRAWKELRETQEVKEPAMIVGTAFSILELLDTLQQTKERFRMPSGSRLMETGGYKGRTRTLPKAELRVLVLERLGVPQNAIVSEYGMSELSSQAYDHVAGQDGSRSFKFPNWARCQIISPETGEDVPQGGVGLVRIHDLANVYSVAAVQTEDLAQRQASGFEIMGRARGAEARGCSLLSV
jgi:hypothetical protein